MDATSSNMIYDVLVIGGGPVGFSAAYEVAKAGKTVMVLEKRNFFNQAGSSGDLARMYRTMYTEDFMADLAYHSLRIWDEFERDAGDNSIRLMTGLLNFGDPEYGAGGPEGTLLGPVSNLERLKMPYRKLTKEEIEALYPFINLPDHYIGLFAPDNGIINVPLFVRTLCRLAKSYGARLHQNTSVSKVEPYHNGMCELWKVISTKENGEEAIYTTEKLIITSGAYTNHILTPSFNIHLDLDIWELTSTYFSVNAGPNGTVFPSMWFQFAEDENGQSNLFYGFPTLPWGPPNIARISVDAASRKIKDPSQRQTNIIDPADVANTQSFVKKHVNGVDGTVPAYSLTCLQTNVFDNMFVLDFLPERYLCGGAKDSVVIFTAGWGMKFVPLLGRALKEMILDGKSDFALPEFAITRNDPYGKEIILDGPVVLDESPMSVFSKNSSKNRGSSMMRMGH